MQTPASECRARAAALQATLAAQGLDGALLLQATDVFYLSGTRQNAVLWLPVSGEPVVLVRKSLERARADSPLADVRPFPPSRELAPVLGGARKVGIGFDTVPLAVHAFWSRALPGVAFADLSAPLRWQRSVKSPWEVERSRATCELLCGVFREVRSFLRAGMREVDLAAEFEARLRRAGNEGSPRTRSFNQEFFMGLAIAGGSATAPSFFDGPVTGRGLSPSSPVGASVDAVPADAPVLLDYTAIKDGYVADMTRIAVAGRLDPALEQAFDASLRIQEEVARGLVPGAVPSKLWARALELAGAAGLERNFMGPPGAQSRFVGHGVGMELDEWPVLAPGFDDPLREGQVIAVEPKFVLPGLGVAGIENTWAVTAAGGERLTKLEDAIVRV